MIDTLRPVHYSGESDRGRRRLLTPIFYQAPNNTPPSLEYLEFTTFTLSNTISTVFTKEQ